jgi:protease-4
VHKAINRFDVRQDVYASGGLKAMLNPFVEQPPEARAKAQDLVNIAGKHFGDELQRMRGNKLQAGVNYTSGAVWGGIEAQQIGLADELATLDEIANTADLTLKEYGPGRRTVTPFAFSSEFVKDWIQQTLYDGIAAAMYSMNTPKFN